MSDQSDKDDRTFNHEIATLKLAEAIHLFKAMDEYFAKHHIIDDTYVFMDSELETAWKNELEGRMLLMETTIALAQSLHELGEV